MSSQNTDSKKKKSPFTSLAWLCVVAALILMVLGSALEVKFLETLSYFMFVLAVIVVVLGKVSAFNAERKKMNTCVCGTPVTYYEGVPYYTTDYEKKEVKRDPNNGDVTTTVRGRFVIEYTCPNCQKVRRYVEGYTKERKVQNITGLVVKHYEDEVTEKSVMKVFEEKFVFATLLDDSGEE